LDPLILGDFMKDRLVFDTTNVNTIADSDSVGAYIRSSNGTLITHTTIGSVEALDVNIANASIVVTATDLDIRNLNHTQDNVAIAQGGNTMIVNADGSINVKADIDVVTGAEKAEDSAHTSGDIGQYVLAVRQDTLAPSTSADGDYASFKVNAAGALYTYIAGSEVLTINDATLANTAILASANTLDTANTAEAVVASALANRKYLYIYNNGNQTIYIGGAGVTSANGFPLSQKSYLELRAGPSVAVNWVGPNTSQNIRVLELS
jgi:hypothetical protein